MRSKITSLLAVFVMAAIATSVFSPTAAFAKREKIRVAVGKFADSSGRNLAGTATDLVTNTFIKLKYFIILERGRIDQVMKELAHQQTGLVDEKTAIEVGKHLGAKVIVVGNVSNAGYERNRTTCAVVRTVNGKMKTVRVPCVVATGTATITVRMVNVETGEIIFSETIAKSSSKTYTGGSQPAPASSMINAALAAACHRLYKPIQKAFPLEAKVIKVEGKIVFVNLGSDWGVARGRGVLIYRKKGKALKDPETGEIIGYQRELIEKDHVGKWVFPTYCQLKVSKKKAALISPGDIVVFKPEIFF